VPLALVNQGIMGYGFVANIDLNLYTDTDAGNARLILPFVSSFSSNVF
jgi:hypothetical protein